MKGIIIRIKNRYSGLSLPLKAAFWFTVCNFLQRGISMITTPIFTRLMSQDEYGLYSTYVSWMTVTAMLSTLSLYKSMMNLFVDYKEEKVLSSVTLLQIIVVSVWVLVGCVFNKQLSNLMKLTPVLIISMMVTTAFKAIIQNWTLYKQYKYDYKKVVFVSFTSSLAIAVFSVILVVCYSPSAASRAVVESFVFAFFGIALAVRIFKAYPKAVNTEIWKFSLVFCIGLLPHYLSEFVLQSSDKIMINYMCSRRDVAVYSVAYSVGNLINLVTSAINASFAPYQYQKIESKEYNKLRKRSNGVMLFVGVALFAIMLFSREIVLIFGGHKYLEGTNCIVPICIGIFFNYMFQMFARVQEYFNRKLTIVIPSILCAILNIVLNYLFIPIFGYVAAAYTTFISYLVFCLVHYYFYKRLTKQVLDSAQIYDGRTLTLISIGVIASGLVILFLNAHPVLKYTVICILITMVIIYRNKLITSVKGLVH